MFEKPNAITERIISIKMNTKPVPLNIFQVYAPTAESKEEDIDKFYEDLQNAKNAYQVERHAS